MMRRRIPRVRTGPRWLVETLNRLIDAANAGSSDVVGDRQFIDVSATQSGRTVSLNVNNLLPRIPKPPTFPQNLEIFEYSPYDQTFTVPGASKGRLIIEAVGGGGGGGGVPNNSGQIGFSLSGGGTASLDVGSGGAGGGGGGGCARVIVHAPVGSELTITVGEGGAGGASGADGTSGTLTEVTGPTTTELHIQGSAGQGGDSVAGAGGVGDPGSASGGGDVPTPSGTWVVAWDGVSGGRGGWGGRGGPEDFTNNPGPPGLGGGSWLGLSSRTHQRGAGGEGGSNFGSGLGNDGDDGAVLIWW